MKEILIKEIDGNKIIATNLTSKEEIIITDFVLYTDPKLLCYNNKILIKVILGNTKENPNYIQACDDIY